MRSSNSGYQAIIDRAVKLATKNALNGNPVKRIIWLPPTSATQDWIGSFAIEYCPPLSAGDTPPWEK